MGTQLCGHLLRERLGFISDGTKCDIKKWLPGLVGAFPEDKVTAHKLTAGFQNVGFLVIAPDKQKYELSRAGEDERLRVWLTESEFKHFGEQIPVFHAAQGGKLKRLLDGEIVQSDLLFQEGKVDAHSHIVLKTGEALAAAGVNYVVCLLQEGHRHPQGQLPAVFTETYMRMRPPLQLSGCPIIHTDFLLRLQGHKAGAIATCLKALQLLDEAVSQRWPETIESRDKRLEEAKRLRLQGLGVEDLSGKKPAPKPPVEAPKRGFLGLGKSKVKSA